MAPQAPPTPNPTGPTLLLGPLQLLFFSASFIPTTILSLLRTYQFQKLLSWPLFQHAWFSTFWAVCGPGSRDRGASTVAPLLSTASGVVLDIGPGTGEWVDLFTPALKTGKINKIFGIEPNYEHHALLRQKVEKAGLGDVYEILGVGAEDLEKCGLQKGGVDTICTLQCLCSISEPQDVVKSLYPYLKAGGRWLVYEHVRTKFQGDFVGYWQRWINHIWPIFFGGCTLIKPTDEWLLTAGEWESVDLKPVGGESKYEAIPFISGVLVKKR